MNSPRALRISFIAVLLFFVSVFTFAQSPKVSLNGEWFFAIDPVKIGEVHRWNAPSFAVNRWDKVTVPHSYSVDPRYHQYTGTAWYIKKFTRSSLPEGYRAFLRFEAVFYKCTGWLNGKKIGEHEGGYTPFEWEVTDALAADNTIAIQVNNEWDQTTIPGAKTEVTYESENSAQAFPWINYGGITRDAYLVIKPEVFIKNVKIVSDPDLVKKSASVKIAVQLKNSSSQNVTPSLTATIYQAGKKIPVKFKTAVKDMAAGSDGTSLLDGIIASKDVKLWSFDEPSLYEAVIVAGSDTLRTRFGIRKLEIKDTKLLLNGEAISLGGCNRPLDYPGYGSIDPKEVLEKDLTLIKSAGMELSRISHYPVSTSLLDWADEHGLMIIAEAGNWQLTPAQMKDPVMRMKFKSQFAEMIERDWNHPSVVAWSVGNEYQSQTPEGQTWTKDMYAFAKELDATRLVTFASMMVWRKDVVKKPEDEASQYVDFISANFYGNHLQNAKHIHEIYPHKPVYISEFGIRTDGVKDESERVNHLRKAMNDFRECDFLIGASIWTFNDYQSRFPGTNANGYRPWGLVTPERELRDMYYTWQEEFAPAQLEVETGSDSKVRVTINARNNFPSYTLRNYKVSAGDQVQDLSILKPGESKTLVFDSNRIKAPAEIKLLKPGGYVVLRKSLK